MKYTIAFAFLIFNTSLFANNLVKLKCFSGGEKPQITFEGSMQVIEINDLPTGAFSIKGKQVSSQRVLISKFLPNCRDWHLIHRVTEGSGGRLNFYDRTKRQWNAIAVGTHRGTMRMVCGIGSIITEYDSTEDFLASIKARWVEPMPPRAGTGTYADGYYSGIGKVSGPHCIKSLL